MRRSLAAVAVGSAIGLVLAGCGLPNGVGGGLTDEWGAMPEPVGFLPEAQVCHQESYAAAGALSDYRPVDCDEDHLLQTAHVGTFTGEAAELESPPQPGSAELREAYDECVERAEEYLGADFRHGRLWLGVVTPSAPGWAGGARWFRCDLSELESVPGRLVERAGSLAGALDGDSEVSLHGCYTVAVEEDEIREKIKVECDESHDTEFVGVWRAPDDGYLDFRESDDLAQVYEGCREIVADYVDVPNDGSMIYRTGVIADPITERDWDFGDRGFRCYLWLPDSDLTGSLADAGTGGLPVRVE